MRYGRNCRRFVVTAMAFSAALLAFGGRRAGAAAMLYGIGDLPGGEANSHLWAVSHAGSVAVGSSFDGGPPPAAVYWTPQDGLVSLRDPAGALIPNIAAVAVAGDGTFVIGPGRDPDSFFRWNRSTRAIEYFTVRTSGLGGEIRGASRDGSVVVGSEFIPQGQGFSRAFRWTLAGGSAPLAAPAGGPTDTHTSDVSADGSLVVGNAFNDNVTVPLTWPNGGAPQRLPVPQGFQFATAGAVSPDGSLIAGTVGNPDGTSHPLLWRGNETVLFSAPAGGNGGGSNAISDTGVIVGLAGREDGSHAALWDAAHGGRWLSDVLAEAGVDVTGWRFLNALDISADGLTIIGGGFNPRGEAEGFVAVLPEPAAATVAPLLCLALLRRRRRR